MECQKDELCEYWNFWPGKRDSAGAFHCRKKFGMTLLSDKATNSISGPKYCPSSMSKSHVTHTGKLCLFFGVFIAAEIHVNHGFFDQYTTDLIELPENPTFNVFDRDFVEWGGTYFKTNGIVAFLGNPFNIAAPPSGKLVVDVKEERLLR